MRLSSLSLSPFILSLGWLPVLCLPSEAQVIPDQTLGTERSTVTPNQPIRDRSADVISGGAARGANLFHSFEQFNVPAEQSVYFANPSGISRIFSRVTGSTPSNIWGTLGVLGNADLLLLNPNGILFGPNARLELGGSFIATTAQSIRFADGTQFLGTDPSKPPLLTSTIPVGLGFASRATAITIQGAGNTLVNPIFLPLLESAPASGLSTSPGRTMALVGGDIKLAGGILRAPQGRIEIGSVDRGFVGMNAIDRGWRLNYDAVSSWGAIDLAQGALVDASGASGGSIDLTGGQISLRGGSAALIRHTALSPSGAIRVTASESVTVAGTTPTSSIASTLLTENIGRGRGGDITLSAPRLEIRNGGQVLARSFGAGRAGNLRIRTTESTRVLGFAPRFPNLFSNISSATFGNGSAGDLQLSTDRLRVTNGSQIGSATFGQGQGGDVAIRANDIVLTGAVPRLLTPAAINAAAFSRGDAGQLTIQTQTLQVLNGARIGTTSVAQGSAGNTTITADESLTVRGTFPGARNPSLIDSSANRLDRPLQQQLRVPAIPTGNAGRLSITTPRLAIEEGAVVSVRNEGRGDAGELQVQTNQLTLSNGGLISAENAGGRNGNLNLGVNGSILLQGNSRITTTARRTSDGGNITMNSAVTALLDTSQISANAQRGRGGRVSIDTQGLFQSPSSSITATSDRGVQFNGVVAINTPETNLGRGTLQSPTTLPAPQIATICQGQSTTAQSQFVISGTGGIPTSPTSDQSSSHGWHQPTTPLPSIATPPAQPVEAQGWTQNDDGTFRLTIHPGDRPIAYAVSNSLQCDPPNS